MMSCYYPTTVVVIDDDQGFLDAIGQHLNIPIRNLHSCPQHAIQNINKTDPYNRIQPRLLQSNRTVYELTDAVHNNYNVTINPYRLHEEIYSSTRFEDVSVIIIDYHMGDINGIDICRELVDHPAKKILLTGGADKESIAINAFNQGIIDRFISKTDKDISLQLTRTIEILKDNYFRHLTNRLIPHSSEAKPSILKNLAYINFIKNLQLQLDASEYYLLEISGSMLFIKNDGTPTWLIIKNDDELDQYAEIASQSDECGSLVESIKNRKLIPVFLSEDDFQQPAHNWNEYLYPATPLPGYERYNYTLIKGHVRNNLIQNHIIPYNQYLNDRNRI